MMPIILFLFLFRLLLEKLLKSRGPQSLIMLTVDSFAILGIALYIILSHGYSSRDTDWAFVSLGIVAGLWLKNTKQQPAVQIPAN